MARCSDPEQWARLSQWRRAELVAHEIERGWWEEWARKDLKTPEAGGGGGGRANPVKSVLGHLFGKK